MSLDNIISKIDEKSRTESAEILSDAKSKAEVIFKENEEELLKLEEDAKKEEAVIENEVKNSIVLPARLKAKGQTLQIQHDYLNKVFDESMKFNDEEYTKVLKYLFGEIPAFKNGELFPAEGKEEVTKKFIESEKIDVTIGKAMPGFDGGFLLKVGRIEYDCSFITLKKKLRDKLEMQVASKFK